MCHLLEGTRLMKTIARALAAFVVLAGMAVVGASPAQADEHKHPEVLEGVYTANIDGQGTTDWTIFPSCVPTVGDLREPLYIPVACRLHVIPAGRSGADAVQVGFRWTFQYNEQDSSRTCPDGSKAPQREIYSFDGKTLVGNLKVIHGEVCGEQPGMTNIPFTLAFKGPLPIPVDRYPLMCEPGGLRRCF
jgi:hypothetical protein